MITKRDLQIVDFVKKFKCCRTSTVAAIFCKNIRIAQRRLNEIHAAKLLKLSKDYKEYVYFYRQPAQLKHSLLLTDFIAKLGRRAELIQCEPEYTIGNVRADALIKYRLNGQIKTAFIEVQLSGAPDTKKYKELFKSEAWKSIFERFPDILIITDSKVDANGLPITVFNTELRRV